MPVSDSVNSFLVSALCVVTQYRFVLSIFLVRCSNPGGGFKTRHTQSTRVARGAGPKYIHVGSLLPSSNVCSCTFYYATSLWQMATEGLEPTSRITAAQCRYSRLFILFLFPFSAWERDKPPPKSLQVSGFFLFSFLSQHPRSSLVFEGLV